MFFVPWQNEQKDLIGSFGTFEARYIYVETPLIPKINEYENHNEELEFARQMMEAEQREYDQTAPNTDKRKGRQKGKKNQKLLCILIQAES